MLIRHEDDGTSIHSFSDLFLVRCPRCDSCAQVIRIGDYTEKPIGKLTCTHCVLSKERRISRWSPHEPFDWCFHLPLWLQTPCCGHVLWAFNPEHLSFIESYIAGEHRVGLKESDADRLRIRNATLASRLPEWMIVAKHRTEVLKCIDKLRQLAKAQEQ